MKLFKDSQSKSKVKVEFVKFREREERTNYVLNRFRKYFFGSVLDVGCDEAPMRAHIPEGRYLGIDIGGQPDIKQDLNKDPSLPFANNSFDTVLVIETLEHIDDLHHLFAECLRVAKNNLIVSLPNCWRDARRPIEKGRGQIAHYGLPCAKPLDRHRWFFNFSDAVQFYVDIQSVHNIKIIEIFGTEQPRNFFLKLARKFIYSTKSYQNRYAQTAWVVFQKN